MNQPYKDLWQILEEGVEAFLERMKEESQEFKGEFIKTLVGESTIKWEEFIEALDSFEKATSADHRASEKYQRLFKKYWQAGLSGQAKQFIIYLQANALNEEISNLLWNTLVDKLDYIGFAIYQVRNTQICGPVGLRFGALDCVHCYIFQACPLNKYY